MTTVINFNVLNFFRLKLDNHTVNNNVRIDNNLSYRGKDEFQGNERVIDVTPYSKVSDSNRDLILRDFPLTDKPMPHSRLLMVPAAIASTYDRRGRAINIYVSKGTYIDSYA